MSSNPLISHRMFVAAVAQERRPPGQGSPAELEHEDEVQWTLDLLDPPGWTSPPAADELPQPALRTEDA